MCGVKKVLENSKSAGRVKKKRDKDQDVSGGGVGGALHLAVRLKGSIRHTNQIKSYRSYLPLARVGED